MKIEEDAILLRVNDNFQKLPGSYLFAEVARRVKVYQEAHPDRRSSAWASAM